jgi:transcriptional regulator with XRE-family HTH domain/tetratricopeptide (TPR) repeat protein
MQRTALREARELKGWTLEEAGEYIGVDKNTVWRWEQGISTPYTYHTERICRAYGMTAAQLGLPQRNPRKRPSGRVKPLLKPVEDEQQELEAVRRRLVGLIGDDLSLRLSCLMDDWLMHARFTNSLSKLQRQVSREVESYETMTKQNHPNHGGIDEGRRAALRTLALIPLQALGLGIVASRVKLAWSPQEFLTHCAAGVTACYYLAKGQHEDMAIASDAITGYLPTLQTLVKESSMHRKEAANLAAQCWHLKTVISLHQGESPQHAVDYGQRALTYAEESEELPLQFDILRRLIWLSICSRQPAQAFKASLKIQSLIEHPAKPVPPLVQSMAYASIARGQAYNNRQQEAFAILPQMYDAYTQVKDEENFIYVEYSGPVWYEGLIHYHLGQYDEAFETFSKIVDPQTLMLKLPMASERSRVETINLLALTALKRPNKDKELIVPLWMAGMQGAKNLRSELRYEEAMAAYGIMEALWSDDAQIRDLRDLMGHW